MRTTRQEESTNSSVTTQRHLEIGIESAGDWRPKVALSGKALSHAPCALGSK